MSKKNLSSISNFPSELDLKNRSEKIYINFQKNTNRKEREGLYEYFSNFDWAVTSEPTLPLKNYEEDLRKYSFVLCPWGNGYDTNRLWEALYFGCIVVTKKHPTFSNLNDLPIIFVDSYDEINHDLLVNYKNNLKKEDINYEKLNVLWWIDYVKKINILDNKLKKEIKQSLIVSKFFIMRWKLLFLIDSKSKKLKYFLFRLKNYFIRIIKNEF